MGSCVPHPGKGAGVVTPQARATGRAPASDDRLFPEAPDHADEEPPQGKTEPGPG